MGTEVAVAGLIIAAAGTTATVVEANKQANLQEEQQKVQSAQQSVEATNQRRRQLREQRVRQAQIEQASQQYGVIGSSGETGATAALATNVMDNVAIGSGRTRTANTIGDLSQKVANSQTRSAMYGAASNLGMAMYSMGEKDFLKLFD